jgi:hypothetical protein
MKRPDLPHRARASSLLLLAATGFLFALALSETVLRRQDRAVWGSERLDDGLFRYDERLGWMTTPFWRGKHRHADYEVEYRTDALGFRADTSCEDGRPVALVAGDSFTFGYGVRDDETFVHHLSCEGATGLCFLNRAVPGFSTDQQVLLLEQELPKARPARVLLVVCLVNDLFDNLSEFPLQGEHAKPYFELAAGGGLALRNVPVPHTVKTPERAAADVARLFAEAPGSEPSPLEAALLRSATYRHLKTGIFPGGLSEEQMAVRFGSALRLFDAILGRLSAACAKQKAELSVVLLPGRSLVMSDRSPPARCQDYLRKTLLSSAREKGWTAIDVAGALRALEAGQRTGLFYPRDGHLTAEGHRVVAELVAAALPPPDELRE